MPQLDRIIIFPQVFWFLLIFILFYTFLSHIFLPKFLSSIRLRKKIMDINNNIFFNLENQLKKDQKFLFAKLQLNLDSLKKSIYLNPRRLNFIFLNSKQLNPIKLDSCIINFIYKNMLYCNKQILNQIKFYPSNFNFK